MQLLRGEATIMEGADRARVDRSTIMKLRQVAKQGALDALVAPRPGVKPNGVDPNWPTPGPRWLACRRRS